MSDLTFTVSFGDVDPYLIHWTAYPKLMDRGSSAALLPALAQGWLESAHLGVTRFRCSFQRPVTLGGELVVRSVPGLVAPNLVQVAHTFRAGDAEVAAGVTEHAATDPGNGWAPLTLPPSLRAHDAADALGHDDLAPGGDKSVSLRRRIHLRQVDTASLHWLAFTDWMDEGTSVLLADLGHPISSLLRQNLAFPLALAEGGIRPGLFIDDEVTVTAYVEGVGRTSLRLAYRLRNGSGAVFGWGRTVHVCTTRQPFVPTQAPDWLRI